MRISDWSSDVCSSDLMVEPQQVIVAHRAEIGEAPRDRLRILLNRIAARCRAIEADAARVGAVVIGRVPFGTIEIADPRRGAVMMAGRHLVREAERDRKSTRLNSSH